MVNLFQARSFVHLPYVEIRDHLRTMNTNNTITISQVRGVRVAEGEVTQLDHTQSILSSSKNLLS